MNWSALTQKQQYMVVGTVVLAILQIVILTYFLKGKGGGVSDSGLPPKEELHQLQVKIDDAKVVMARAERIKDALRESVMELEELGQYTPTVSDRYAWAYEYISLRAARAGIELDSLEEVTYLSEDDVDPDSLPYEIRLSARCGYNRLVEFLWRIEQSNPLLRVKEVDMMTFSDSPAAHQVKVVLQWPAPLEVSRGSLTDELTESPDGEENTL